MPQDFLGQHLTLEWTSGSGRGRIEASSQLFDQAAMVHFWPGSSTIEISYFNKLTFIGYSRSVGLSVSTLTFTST